MTRLRTFPRAWRQLHIISSSFDWFTVLYVARVICSDLVLQYSFENRSLDDNLTLYVTTRLHASLALPQTDQHNHKLRAIKIVSNRELSKPSFVLKRLKESMTG